ncbi:MAG: hypothetical protein Q4D85_11295 [Corynebacterium sp.]|uniref:hypothetical protein n=1 Tax=Corynebacterium sp. TaxID=1720 RepID=UPI0026DCBC6A|nr:hypothetical protein [Corynebacterium sp.]MDO5099320.1 hypothetical protein [Corynebacterium sp.]
MTVTTALIRAAQEHLENLDDNQLRKMQEYGTLPDDLTWEEIDDAIKDIDLLDLYYKAAAFDQITRTPQED